MIPSSFMRYLNPNQQNDFNQSIWEIARMIPYGKVATYGQLAKLADSPQGIDAPTYKAWGPRWVGTAMAACPDNVPWHRVINAKGEVSLRRGGGYERQRSLLVAEGVVFDERNRIDLKRYLWDGKSPSIE